MQMTKHFSFTFNRFTGAFAGEFVLFTLLFSPLIVQQIGIGRGFNDRLWLINVVTSICWLTLIWCISRRPLYSHLLLLPLYITSALDLFILTTFKTRLSSGIVTTMLTNAGEFAEFATTYRVQISKVFLAFFVLYGLAIFLIRERRRPVHKSKALIAGVALMLIYSGLTFLSLDMGIRKATQITLGKDLSTPFGVGSQAALSFALAEEMKSLRTARTSHDIGGSLNAPIHRPVLVILVIGESSRKQSWSLFGYGRDTTPNLRTLAGIVPLRNYMATASTTSWAVPSMLSLDGIEDFNKIQSRKSVVSAFRNAKFDTYWFSAQEADSWAGLTPYIAAEAQVVRYFDNVYDGVMLDDLGDVVLSSKDRNTLLVVHTKGSHFQYKNRYPKEFEYFKGGTSAKNRYIDEYDNSIVYTDWFLSRLIDSVKSSQRPAALIFASDHGENLMDDERELLGHSFSNTFDLSPAAFVWFSDGFKAAKPDKWNALVATSDSALSHSNLGHSLLDLAGVGANGFVQASSFASKDFAALPRLVIDHGKLQKSQQLKAKREVNSSFH